MKIASPTCSIAVTRLRIDSSVFFRSDMSKNTAETRPSAIGATEIMKYFSVCVQYASKSTGDLL